MCWALFLAVHKTTFSVFLAAEWCVCIHGDVGTCMCNTVTLSYVSFRSFSDIGTFI